MYGGHKMGASGRAKIEEKAKLARRASFKLANVATEEKNKALLRIADSISCLLYTSPSPRDVEESRMPSSA